MPGMLLLTCNGLGLDHQV